MLYDSIYVDRMVDSYIKWMNKNKSLIPDFGQVIWEYNKSEILDISIETWF